ncbi:MAG: DUF2800 domain-containing protein [Deltaproteobacteria bacterium]|nr:DUF2800 domain-containing protein [Deltaproteobacteria bacterium]
MPKAPLEHSILGASSCERWWNCPGSVEAVKKYKNEESKYAAEGTVAHGIIANELEMIYPRKQISGVLGKALSPKVRESLDKKIGDTVMQGDFEIEITEEMVDAVMEFLQLVAEEADPGCVIKIEERVDLSKENKHLFGTSDVVIIKPFEWIKVMDFKYGAGIKVNAWENKQGLFYLTCAWEGEDVEHGEVIICQPRKENGTSRYAVTHEQYQKFKYELIVSADEALKKKAVRVAGAWCKKSFCPAFADCPAADNMAHEIVARDFDSPIAPDKLSISKIQMVLEKAEFITAWMNAVNARAKELMLAGEDIPGFKLVQGYGHRKWQSEASVEEDFADLGDKLFEKPKLKSPAKLEKLIGKDKIADYAYKPETAVKLVPDSAKGDPLQINVKADYD